MRTFNNLNATGLETRKGDGYGRIILPVQPVSYGPLIMSIMLIMSCYTGFFNVRGGRVERVAISQHGTSVLFTSHPQDGLVVNFYIPHNRRTPLQAEEALCPICIVIEKSLSCMSFAGAVVVMIVW